MFNPEAICEKPVLSDREKQIAKLVAQSLSNKQVAEQLSISKQTVRNHLHNIFDKLGIFRHGQLMQYLSGECKVSTTTAAWTTHQSSQ
jgi:DNA-binding CsgD family transcriptional regulator